MQVPTLKHDFVHLTGAANKDRSNTTPTARLERWCVTPLDPSPFQPPEVSAHGLHGLVYGHSRFPDGDEITTSEMASLEQHGDNIVVITRSGSRYLLGTVDPDYEVAYPGARARIVKAYTTRVNAEAAHGRTTRFPRSQA